MGYIDEVRFTFSCPSCHCQEEARAVERGSSYGASWGNPSALSKFNVLWTTDQFGAPDVVDAKCSACGVKASVAGRP